MSYDHQSVSGLSIHEWTRFLPSHGTNLRLTRFLLIRNTMPGMRVNERTKTISRTSEGRDLGAPNTWIYKIWLFIWGPECALRTVAACISTMLCWNASWNWGSWKYPSAQPDYTYICCGVDHLNYCSLQTGRICWEYVIKCEKSAAELILIVMRKKPGLFYVLGPLIYHFCAPENPEGLRGMHIGNIRVPIHPLSTPSSPCRR